MWKSNRGDDWHTEVHFQWKKKKFGLWELLLFFVFFCGLKANTTKETYQKE